MMWRAALALPLIFAACSSPALDQTDTVRLLTTPDTGVIAGIYLGEPWDRVVGDHPGFALDPIKPGADRAGVKTLRTGAPEGYVAVACFLDDAGKVRRIEATVGGRPAQNARVVDAVFRDLRAFYDHATDAKSRCTERHCDYTTRTGAGLAVEFVELADQAAIATITAEPKPDI